MFYPLISNSWGPEEAAAINAVIDSDRFTIGPQVDAFEEKFADYMGCKHALMVNSGSSANLLAVAAFCYHKDRPLKPGDEVIVPAISWATTYHPLQQYGLKLRFLDIELDSLNMDCSLLEQALTPRTRAITGVSILGNPAALDVMRAFADKHDLWFFEDNCESLDARLGGKLAGSFGDIATFSFFFSHHISTMEGGMLVTDDTELYHLARSMRAHGWTRDLPADSPIVEHKDTDFYEAYRFILPGYNVRPMEFNAATGLIQLEKLPAMTSMRRQNLALLQNLFRDDPRFIIQKENGESSSFSFPIVLNPDMKIDRSDVMAALGAAEIEYRIITGGNFLRHDVLKYYDYDVVGSGAPNADIAHDRGFFVGNHPYDLSPQIEHLYEVLNKSC